jgi:hypothetical protein
LFLSLIFAGFCWGDDIITNSAYGLSDPGVKGTWQNYDIQSIDFGFTGSTFTVTLDFNYGLVASPGKANYTSGSWNTLGTFKDGGVSNSPGLNPGDLLFWDPADNVEYGIALSNHTVSSPSGQVNLVQGDLYVVTATETAGTVLSGSGLSASQYNPTDTVWIGSIGSATPVAGTNWKVAAADGGTPTAASPMLIVTDTFSLSSIDSKTQAALNTTKPNIDVSFASATCGNDLLAGAVAYVATPEPSSICLAFGGLLLAGIGLIRRKRSV